MRTISIATLALAGLFAIAPALTAAHGDYTHIKVGERADVPGELMYFDPMYVEIGLGKWADWKNYGNVMHEISFVLETPLVDVPIAFSTSDPTVELEFHEHIDPGENTRFQFTVPGIYQVHCNLGAGHSAGHMIILVQ